MTHFLLYTHKVLDRFWDRSCSQSRPYVHSPLRPTTLASMARIGDPPRVNAIWYFDRRSWSNPQRPQETMLQRDMAIMLSTVTSLSDDALLGHVTTLAARERHATAELIAALAELDARRLYLGAGCSSLFTYCTQILHLSEHAAYGRIEGARLARRFPEVLDRLADGSLTLTAVCLLGPVLTEVNAAELLDAARHKTKREVEHLVARIRPLPAVTTSVRKLPAPRAAPVLTMAGTSPPTPPPCPRTAGRRPRHRRGRRSCVHCQRRPTRSSSPCRAKATDTSGARRTCCGTASRTATSDA